MPTPSSGPISFQNLNNTFGTGVPVSMQTLYRGGDNVPNITPDNTIPTAGAISLHDFYATWGRKTLSFTITVGSGPAVSGGKGTLYGYKQSEFGSISASSFLTPNGTMTIKELTYSAGAGSWRLHLGSTSAPADTDLSFRSVAVTGYTVNGVRSARTTTSADSTSRIWAWNVGSVSHPTSGTITCTLNYYG